MSCSVDSDSTGLTLHGLMSQGLNVVISKRIMGIDTRYEQALMRLEDKWQDKFDRMEATLLRQGEKMDAIQVELKVTKMALKAARGESAAWKRQAQHICTTVQNQSHAMLADIKESRRGGEACRNQVDNTLTLLKREFEAIVAHIGQHDSSMAATKLEMERRLHTVAEATQCVHNGFLEQKMELMSIRNTLRGMERHPTTEVATASAGAPLSAAPIANVGIAASSSPPEQGDDVVSIFMNNSIDLVNVSIDEAKEWRHQQLAEDTHDMKECISVLSSDSYDSLRQELERQIQSTESGPLTRPTTRTMMTPPPPPPRRETVVPVQREGEALSPRQHDLALRIAQAKDKFQSLKIREATRKDDSCVINIEMAPVAKTQVSNDKERSAPREKDGPKFVLDENNQKGVLADDIQGRINNPSCERVDTMESGTSVATTERKHHGKKVTFITENDDGEAELEYLVLVGESQVVVDALAST